MKYLIFILIFNLTFIYSFSQENIKEKNKLTKSIDKEVLKIEQQLKNFRILKKSCSYRDTITFYYNKDTLPIKISRIKYTDDPNLLIYETHNFYFDKDGDCIKIEYINASLVFDEGAWQANEYRITEKYWKNLIYICTKDNGKYRSYDESNNYEYKYIVTEEINVYKKCLETGE